MDGFSDRIGVNMPVSFLRVDHRVVFRSDGMEWI